MRLEIVGVTTIIALRILQLHFAPDRGGAEWWAFEISRHTLMFVLVLGALKLIWDLVLRLERIAAALYDEDR